MLRDCTPPEATLVIDHFIITEEVLQEGDYCIYREATLVIDHFIITEEVLKEGDYCIYREATLVIDHFIIAEEVLQEGDYCIYFSPFYFIVLSSLKQGTVKPVHVVTSIKQSPVLKGHFFVLS